MAQQDRGQYAIVLSDKNCLVGIAGLDGSAVGERQWLLGSGPIRELAFKVDRPGNVLENPIGGCNAGFRVNINTEKSKGVYRGSCQYQSAKGGSKDEAPIKALN